MTTARALLLFPVAVVALTGCGGGGGGGGSAQSKGGPNPKGVNGISVGNCLNDEEFLVSPSETTLEGTSPAGVSFTLTFYKTPAAAEAVYKKKNPKTTALVENAVVDFKGNISPYAGAPPAKISQKELGVIKKCIDASK